MKQTFYPDLLNASATARLLAWLTSIPLRLAVKATYAPRDKAPIAFVPLLPHLMPSKDAS